MILVAFVLAAVGSQQALPQVPQGPNTIAMCLLRKVDDHNEDVGPRILLGWRFDDAVTGPVTFHEEDIHDPGKLLHGQTIDEIIATDRSKAFMLVGPSVDGHHSREMMMTVPSDIEKGIYNVSIMVPVSGGLKHAYFGNCIIKNYGPENDAFFAGMKKLGALDIK